MSTPAIYADIVYATTPQRELRMDIRVPQSPDGKPLPIVLFIPMGGMRICDKESAPWWFTDYGFAMASIECRVRDEAIAPAAVHDCKAAVRFLRRYAADYGFNGNAIGAWGRSAGGLLASLLATSGDRPELRVKPDDGISDAIQAACDQCGAPHDFFYFTRADIIEKYAGVAENIRLYLGGEIAAQPELARLVSPSSYISPQCPPVIIFHGDQDTAVPLDESIDFHQKLLGAGVDSTLHAIKGGGHSLEEAIIRDDIVAFFRRVLVE